MTNSPGWYRDPAEPTTQRYWDGEGWLGASLPVDATPPEGPLPLPPPPPAPETPPPTAQTAPPAPGKLGPQAPPGVPYRMLPPVRPHGMMLATPGARMVARLIDITLILLLNAVVNGWFVYQWLTHAVPYMRDVMQAIYDDRPVTEITRPETMDSLLLVIALIFAALWMAYEVPSTARTGQTVGKRAARIKVVRMESQEPLGFPRSFWRWSFMGLPILLLGCCGPFFIVLPMADVFWVAVDRVQRMALHDRSAATYVVKLPGAPGQKGR